MIVVNSLSASDGQNLNFAIPVSYLDRLDTDMPYTLAQFVKLEKGRGSSEGGQNTSGYQIAASADDLTLAPYGSAFVVIATDVPGGTESLSYDIEGEGVLCGISKKSTLDGQLAVLFITLNDQADRTKVTVYSEDDTSVNATVTVTADPAVPKTYFSTEGGSCTVPDLGACFGILPSSYTVDYDDCWMEVFYSPEDLAEIGQTFESLKPALDREFAAAGYTAGTRADESKATYPYTKSGTDEAAGVGVDSDGDVFVIFRDQALLDLIKELES